MGPLTREDENVHKGGGTNGKDKCATPQVNKTPSQVFPMSRVPTAPAWAWLGSAKEDQIKVFPPQIVGRHKC